MLSKPSICFLSLIFLTILSAPVLAEDLAEACGDPPPVSDEKLKGEIKGQAKFLSGFLGGAELGGEIETSRNEIFSRYPPGERSNAYFEYQVCLLLMSDDSLTTREKLMELREIRDGFAKPLSVLTDENELFKTRIVSSSKSADGLTVTIAAMIESKVGYNFVISNDRKNGFAIDNQGNKYDLDAMTGIGINNTNCGGIHFAGNFTLITPGSNQNLIMYFKSNNSSDGNVVDFSSNFCVKTETNTFSLPIGISNIKVGDPNQDQRQNQTQTKSGKCSVGELVTLRFDKWAEFELMGDSSWQWTRLGAECIFIHGDRETDPDKHIRNCPGQTTRLNISQKVWMAAEGAQTNICVEGISFVGYR
ncbi:MAG: hypothetical protein AAGA75_26420 [Cyanobacteria bacterium P01_E01_bin.6]